MSTIFQEVPPLVKIHPLPRRAKFITYMFDDTMRLTAWMPGGIYSVSGQTRESSDTFYENNCRGCERNCESFLEDYRDEESGEIDWDEVGYHCDVYNEGFYGQECPKGYEQELTEYDFKVPEMAFEIRLNYRIPITDNRNTRELESQSRYFKRGDSAYLCGSKIEDSYLYATETYIPSNVFGEHENPGLICWGRVAPPDTLRGIESNFFATPFNNDLIKIDEFYENSIQVQRDSENPAMYDEICSQRILIDNEHSEHTMDNLVIVDAEHNVPAFFTLLCAGFKPDDNAPHVMMIPARETELQREGMTFKGYLTCPDALGKEWFISSDKLLVGQI